jgi:hypothetical protein
MFTRDGKIVGFDGSFEKAPDELLGDENSWETLRPEQVREALAAAERRQQGQEASERDQPVPAAPEAEELVNTAGGQAAKLLTRDPPELWFFTTREGAKGVLQIKPIDDNPGALRIRYKLVRTSAAGAMLREDLTGRFEAASSIGGAAEKDEALAALATDAAKSGEADLVKQILRQMYGNTERDVAALESARLLAQLGMRRPAIEIAKSITSASTRDLALSELAR